MNKKRIFILSLLLILFFSMANSSVTLAAEPQIEYWPLLTSTDRFKKWQIKFNLPLDPDTVTTTNVDFTDENNTFYWGLDMELTDDNKTLILEHKLPTGYDKGKMYYIHLKKGLKSIDNKSLKKEIVIPFVIRTEGTVVSDILMRSSVSELVDMLGQPDRIDPSEYDFDWYIYNRDYKNYIQVGIYGGEVVSVYSAKYDLLPSDGITLGMTRDEVEKRLDKYGEYMDGYLIDDNLVEFYYDPHGNNELIGIWVRDYKYANSRYDHTDNLIEGFEKQMFDLANVARTYKGLQAYKWNQSVANTARKHSEDMADNNYFSHIDLSGRSPWERLSDDNINVINAAENISAGHQNPIRAHHSLMTSKGHRDNILSFLEELGVGITFKHGVADGTNFYRYYTQKFITAPYRLTH